MTAAVPAGTLPKHCFQYSMHKAWLTLWLLHSKEGSKNSSLESPPKQESDGLMSLLPADKNLHRLLGVGGHYPGRHAENHRIRENRGAQ